MLKFLNLKISDSEEKTFTFYNQSHNKPMNLYLDTLQMQHDRVKSNVLVFSKISEFQESLFTKFFTVVKFV